jgi:hypothetical protein
MTGGWSWSLPETANEGLFEDVARFRAKMERR